MDQRLSVVTLGVRDLPRARAFYEALGWTTGAGPDDDVVFFQAAGLVIGLWSREALAEAETAGATIGRPGAKTFWGGYSGVFVDPDGHPWEVAHNPHWTLREDRTVQLN